MFVDASASGWCSNARNAGFPFPVDFRPCGAEPVRLNEIRLSGFLLLGYLMTVRMPCGAVDSYGLCHLVTKLVLSLGVARHKKTGLVDRFENIAVGNQAEPTPV